MAVFNTLIEVVEYFPWRDRIKVTSTTRGTHSRSSYHYRAMAVDLGSGPASSVEHSCAAWLYQYSSDIAELINTRPDGSGWFVKHSVRRGRGFYGRELENKHKDHVHLACSSQAQADRLLARVRKARPALKQGMSGTYVKLAQRKLGVTVDGEFGPGTAAAVVEFQKAQRIGASGVIGRQTWSRLRA